MLPFSYHPEHCFSSLLCISDRTYLIGRGISRANPSPRLRILDVLCTLLLLTLTSGTGHFCQPLYIPVEVRLWHHPLSRGRSLSRYTRIAIWLPWLGVVRSGVSPNSERLFDGDYSPKLLTLRDDVLCKIQPEQRLVLDEQRRVDLAADEADFDGIDHLWIGGEEPLAGAAQLR